MDKKINLASNMQSFLEGKGMYQRGGNFLKVIQLKPIVPYTCVFRFFCLENSPNFQSFANVSIENFLVLRKREGEVLWSRRNFRAF